jgi:hypothetical protein
MIPALAPRWIARDVPLPPVAVAVPRAVARLLATRWRTAAGAAVESLRAAATPSALLLFGDVEALPWADGVLYLGRDPEAPRLLVPTALAPDVPIGLFERALFTRWPATRAPAALLLEPMRLADAASPGPLDLASLRAWLGGDS